MADAVRPGTALGAGLLWQLWGCMMGTPVSQSLEWRAFPIPECQTHMGPAQHPPPPIRLLNPQPLIWPGRLCK